MIHTPSTLGTLHGGKFRRLTQMVSWHLTWGSSL
jgi:hypothetical protein